MTYFLGLQEKLVEIMMQQAGNCIDVKNFTQALSILEELEPIIIVSLSHVQEKQNINQSSSVTSVTL